MSRLALVRHNAWTIVLVVAVCAVVYLIGQQLVIRNLDAVILGDKVILGIDHHIPPEDLIGLIVRRLQVWVFSFSQELLCTTMWNACLLRILCLHLSWEVS